MQDYSNTDSQKVSIGLGFGLTITYIWFSMKQRNIKINLTNIAHLNHNNESVSNSRDYMP